MTTSIHQAAWKLSYYPFTHGIITTTYAAGTIPIRWKWICVTWDSKLRDLGFLVTHGFNLKRSIRDYKKDREEYITSAIPQTFIFYIIYMRFSEYHHFTEFVLRKLSERKLISLFIDEVTLRFDPTQLDMKFENND